MELQQMQKQIRSRRQLNDRNEFIGPELGSFPLPIGFIPFPFHKFKIYRHPQPDDKFVGAGGSTENLSLSPDQARKTVLRL
jgi:hypothetical protein